MWRPRLDVLWLETDVRFRTTFIRLLRHAARREADLVFRVADTSAQALELVPTVDRVVAEVCIGPPGNECGVDFLEAMRAEHDTPVVVFSNALTPSACERLEELHVRTIGKNGAFADSAALARAIIHPRRPPPREGRDPYEAFLDAIDGAWGRAKDELELRAIARALAREGTIAGAARKLGMKLSTLQSKLTKLGMKPVCVGRARARASR